MDRGNSPFPATKRTADTSTVSQTRPLPKICGRIAADAEVVDQKPVSGLTTMRPGHRAQLLWWTRRLSPCFTSAGKVLLPPAIGLPLRQTYHVAWGRHFGPPRDSRPTSPIYLP
jgi:hypothetical protein